MKVISLFSGAGGLDKGFERAGFEIVFANEYDRSIWDTYRANFRGHLDTRSITDVPESDLPRGVDGIIGGPPCQSWSEAGARRGIEDKRGQLFHEYIRVLSHVRPKFFLAENVSGILSARHRHAFSEILDEFANLGYRVSHRLLNAADHGVPQDRDRVIIVGIHRDIEVPFEFPAATSPRPTLQEAIGGMPAPIAVDSYSATAAEAPLPNHEYLEAGFSPIYLSRNRVRGWDEPSFTIQAGARHAPIHPQAPKMQRHGPDDFRFKSGSKRLYRRLSVRECARIQTFDDAHQFVYRRIADGYKMVGNAVPVELARRLAMQIRTAIMQPPLPADAAPSVLFEPVASPPRRTRSRAAVRA